VMNAATINAIPAVDAADVLRLRAWARARLFAEGELDLQEAVDVLAAAAERDGIDTDLAQQIIASEFAGHQ
jgi:hypothetical protein